MVYTDQLLTSVDHRHYICKRGILENTQIDAVSHNIEIDELCIRAFKK
jgi:hypothetical protein